MRTYNIMRLGDIAFEGNKSKNYAHGRFVENTIGDGIVSHVFDVFRPIVDYDLFFWKYLINNEGVMGRIMTRCTKASTMMTNLVANDFLKEEIVVPSIDEQKEIGKYLDSLDHLITLHQRKYDSLVNVKKAMLEKMFPKNGETVPEIRFKGFTDAWEQRKLGEITESYSGGTPTVGNNAYYDGDIPFIRSGEISGDYTELFITSEGLNSSSAKMVKEGDILYALYGATSGEVSISKLKGAINQAILAIQPHQNYDNQFLMQWLKKSKKYIIDTYLQGGQGNLSGNIVKNLPVDLPTYDEQHQIGAYFKHLDNLITLHQRKQFLKVRR